jgi:hypothetical protein
MPQETVDPKTNKTTSYRPTPAFQPYSPPFPEQRTRPDARGKTYPIQRTAEQLMARDQYPSEYDAKVLGPIETYAIQVANAVTRDWNMRPGAQALQERTTYGENRDPKKEDPPRSPITIQNASDIPKELLWGDGDIRKFCQALNEETPQGKGR